MSNTNIVLVDTVKLENLRNSLGMNHSAFGERVGHEKSWYSSVKERGTMRKNDIMLIKHEFGVDVEKHDIVVTEAKEVKDAPVAIDYNKLAEVVAKVIDYDKLSDAMYKAMVKALNGESGQIQE